MSDVQLGYLASEQADRDATHVAVVPMVAAVDMDPGTHCGLVGTNTVSPDVDVMNKAANIFTVIDRFQVSFEVPVEVRQDESGVYLATSPLVRGLLVVSKDKDTIAVKVRDALNDLAAVARSL